MSRSYRKIYAKSVMFLESNPKDRSTGKKIAAKRVRKTLDIADGNAYRKIAQNECGAENCSWSVPLKDFLSDDWHFWMRPTSPKSETTIFNKLRSK